MSSPQITALWTEPSTNPWSAPNELDGRILLRIARLICPFAWLTGPFASPRVPCSARSNWLRFYPAKTKTATKSASVRK
jgi:hypothetical protein